MEPCEEYYQNLRDSLTHTLSHKMRKHICTMLGLVNMIKLQILTKDEFMIHVLMTTIAMVIGMLPIAFATGGVGAIKHGMAWVIIGGLLSSMFLTLIVVPVMYKIMDRIMEKLGWGNTDKKKQIREQMIAPVAATHARNNHKLNDATVSVH